MQMVNFSKTNILALLANVAETIRSHHGFDENNGWAQVENKGTAENIAYEQYKAFTNAYEWISCGDWGVAAGGTRFSRAGLKQALETSIAYLVNQHGFTDEPLYAPSNYEYASMDETKARFYGRFIAYTRLNERLHIDRFWPEQIIDPLYRVSHYATDTAKLFKELALDSSIIDEVKDFKALCESLTPSKQTHYDRLDEWSDAVYAYIDEMLTKHGFINGGVKNGQPPAARFWWKLYRLPNFVCDSPNMVTCVANHHASAHERNETMKTELGNILKLIS